MLARRTNGFPVVGRMRDEIDRAFGHMLHDMAGFEPFAAFGPRAYPALNVWEDGQALYAEAELPGLSMNELEITVMGNELTLKGERKDAEVEGAAWHRRERPVGTFTRVLRLAVDIDAEHVEASLTNGVLTVRLPKAEKAKARRIEVKTS